MVSGPWSGGAAGAGGGGGGGVLLLPGLTFRFGTNPRGPNYALCQWDNEHSGSGSREATHREITPLPGSRERGLRLGCAPVSQLKSQAP